MGAVKLIFSLLFAAVTLISSSSQSPANDDTNQYVTSEFHSSSILPNLTQNYQFNNLYNNLSSGHKNVKITYRRKGRRHRKFRNGNGYGMGSHSINQQYAPNLAGGFYSKGSSKFSDKNYNLGGLRSKIQRIAAKKGDSALLYDNFAGEYGENLNAGSGKFRGSNYKVVNVKNKNIPKNPDFLARYGDGVYIPEVEQVGVNSVSGMYGPSRGHSYSESWHAVPSFKQTYKMTKHVYKTKGNMPMHRITHINNIGNGETKDSSEEDAKFIPSSIPHVDTATEKVFTGDDISDVIIPPNNIVEVDSSSEPDSTEVTSEADVDVFTDGPYNGDIETERPPEVNFPEEINEPSDSNEAQTPDDNIDDYSNNPYTNPDPNNPAISDDSDVDSSDDTTEKGISEITTQNESNDYLNPDTITTMKPYIIDKRLRQRPLNKLSLYQKIAQNNVRENKIDLLNHMRRRMKQMNPGSYGRDTLDMQPNNPAALDEIFDLDQYLDNIKNDNNEPIVDTSDIGTNTHSLPISEFDVSSRYFSPWTTQNLVSDICHTARKLQDKNPKSYIVNKLGHILNELRIINNKINRDDPKYHSGSSPTSIENERGEDKSIEEPVVNDKPIEAIPLPDYELEDDVDQKGNLQQDTLLPRDLLLPQNILTPQYKQKEIGDKSQTLDQLIKYLQTHSHTQTDITTLIKYYLKHHKQSEDTPVNGRLKWRVKYNLINQILPYFKHNRLTIKQLKKLLIILYKVVDSAGGNDCQTKAYKGILRHIYQFLNIILKLTKHRHHVSSREPLLNLLSNYIK